MGWGGIEKKAWEVTLPVAYDARWRWEYVSKRKRKELPHSPCVLVGHQQHQQTSVVEAAGYMCMGNDGVARRSSCSNHSCEIDRLDRPPRDMVFMCTRLLLLPAQPAWSCRWDAADGRHLRRRRRRLLMPRRFLLRRSSSRRQATRQHTGMGAYDPIDSIGPPSTSIDPQPPQIKPGSPKLFGRDGCRIPRPARAEGSAA